MKFRPSRLRCLYTGVALIVLSVGVSSAEPPDDNDDAAVTTFSAQPGAKAPTPRIKNQPEDDRTLEIAPQPGVLPPKKSIEEIPAGREYKPADNTASLEKKFAPNEAQPGDKKRLPYIGISVEYTMKCYSGQEERGLEIVNIDPNSPAAQAELQAKGGLTALGAAGATAGALLGPLNLAVLPLLKKAGQLGKDGDLIVAVDDRRVRSEFDLEDELAKLKPGDTMYLTVIRPLPSGAHKTMKIAVKVGEPNSKLAAGSAPAVGPSGTEQPAY